LDRLSLCIDKAMHSLGALKVSLAMLQSQSQWDRSGRTELIGNELFRLRKRTGASDDSFVLAPTHEEEVTQLIADTVSSHRQLPLRLYQIGPKFRNEARPRGGLLRCREFIMKDLYTFDNSPEEAMRTYESVCTAYRRLFEQLKLPHFKAAACSGAIGGTHSHEFHLATNSGEDELVHCARHCGFAANAEIAEKSVIRACPSCGSNTVTTKGLEIGHTFLLGSKYSNVFNAQLSDSAGNLAPIQMGCYGIGVSRLMAAIVEASHDSHGIIWPETVSPFDAYVLAENPGSAQINALPSALENVLIDDRNGLSFSRKFKDGLLSGIPLIVVLNSKKSASGIEIHRRCPERGTVLLDSFDELAHSIGQ
jgi:prolyl-tRNA synthetase